jgi:hypothetical protein
MNKIKYLAVCAVLGWATSVVQAATEYRDFTNTEGKVIKGALKVYNSLDNTVTIERANRKTFTVPVTVFSEVDQAYINTWKNQEGVRRSSKFNVSCDRRVVKDWSEKHTAEVYDRNTQRLTGDKVEVAKTDFDEIAYEITLKNSNGYALESLYLEYCIYYEQELALNELKGSSDDVSEEKEGVLYGSIEVGEIAGRKAYTTHTETIVLYKHAQTIETTEKVPFRLSNKINGIAIRLYVQEGDEKILLREEATPSSVTKKREWVASSIDVGANTKEEKKKREKASEEGEA